MPSDATIDFTPYARPPRIDAVGGIALAIRIIRAAEKDVGKSTVRALQKVRAAAIALQEELKKRGRTNRSIKPIDISFDLGWSALRDRIGAWTNVHAPAHEKVRKHAAQIIAAYFHDGVSFVTTSFEAQWVHSQQLLDRFEEEEVVSDVERLAGAPFLENVRVHHAALGAALDLSGASAADMASTTGVAERVAALAEAIGEYTRRYAGEVDTDDPKSVAAFRSAMAPLDRYRAAPSGMARGGGGGTDGGEEPVDPTQPVPPVPGPTEG